LVPAFRNDSQRSDQTSKLLELSLDTHFNATSSQTEIPKSQEQSRKGSKNAKRGWINTRAEELHDIKFDPKTGYEGHYSDQGDMKMRKSNGKIAMNNSKNASVMDNHFTEVCNNNQPIDITILNDLKQQETIADLGIPPTDEEFAAALRKIANGKLSGGSGITPEALKYLDYSNTRILREF
jgi:hypothetical protein